MNAIAISLIFFAQCTYLLAAPVPACTFGDKSVSMVLYTSKFPDGKNIGVQECCENINKSKPIIFTTHGFLSKAQIFRTHNVPQNLVKKGYIVFAVDWREPACTNEQAGILQYHVAVSNILKVANFLGSYIQQLLSKCGVPIGQITLIGHSLGAHVSGFAAKKIKKLGLGTVPLIIAADPAAPLFSCNKCEERVCETDTKRLVVFHTTGTLGLSCNIGHLDLYFNNGGNQPGCWLASCSHTRAIEYITSVVLDNCAFVGIPDRPESGWFGSSTPRYPTRNEKHIIIDSKILNKNDTKQGEYYVFVNENYPYCTEKTSL